ncbi:hypothetical protein AWB78_05910 [Caballeronia calidae]|uniref:Purine nucleoside phosphorylase n=1 Tax=Caballeronia calidae TaxID=1777139 RepID=A0A158E031_9BURK|nr:DUF4148 domain-containing protein [Caballeronia calidae]SAL00229.1 hypothetical protein AWB78_05910 [Caballeronia calidae]
MKVLKLAAVAAASVVTITAFAAEPAAPLTRNQVKAELEALHSVGYSPQDWVHYPDNIQAAERKIKSQQNPSEPRTQQR